MGIIGIRNYIKKAFILLLFILLTAGISPLQPKIGLQAAEPNLDGEITPSILEEPADITDIEVTKLSFELKDIQQIYAVKAPGRGGLSIALAQADNIPFTSLKMQVYSDSLLTKPIGESCTLKQDSSSKKATTLSAKEYEMPKAGTYYLKFTYKASADAVTPDMESESVPYKTFGMTAAFMYSTDRTLTVNKQLMTYANEKKRAVYYKVPVKKAGLLSFSAVPEQSTDLLTGKTALCDSKKQMVSVNEYVSGSKDNNHAVNTYYMVKPGTYYIRAKLNISYIASIQVQSINDKAGNSLNSAGNLKWNGKAKLSGLYCKDGEEKTKWFKFKLDKNKNFTITVHSSINGYLNIEVCDPSGLTVKSGKTRLYTGTKILKSKNKWEKGWYYVKISKEKKSEYSSGCFSISVGK